MCVCVRDTVGGERVFTKLRPVGKRATDDDDDEIRGRSARTGPSSSRFRAPPRPRPPRRALNAVRETLAIAAVTGR